MDQLRVHLVNKFEARQELLNERQTLEDVSRETMKRLTRAVSIPVTFFGFSGTAFTAGDHGFDQVVSMQNAFGDYSCYM